MENHCSDQEYIKFNKLQTLFLEFKLERYFIVYFKSALAELMKRSMAMEYFSLISLMTRDSDD